MILEGGWGGRAGGGRDDKEEGGIGSGPMIQSMKDRFLKNSVKKREEQQYWR